MTRLPTETPAAETEPTWTLTRSQLIDALAAIEVRGVQVSGPMAGKVIADHMADAILHQFPRDAGGDAVTVSREDLRAVLLTSGSDLQLVNAGSAQAWNRLSALAWPPTDGPGHGQVRRDMAAGSADSGAATAAEPRASTGQGWAETTDWDGLRAAEVLRDIDRVGREYPDGVHTCAELQRLEPGRRPCTCGRCSACVPEPPGGTR